MIGSIERVCSLIRYIESLLVDKRSIKRVCGYLSRGCVGPAA